MKKYKDIAGDGGSNIVGQVEAQQRRLRERLATVHAVVAIVSGKGGVGKSSLTANLACGLAQSGLRVGVLDADLNGPTMAKMLGVRGQRLVLASGGVEPPRTTLGVKVMSMDLLLPSDSAPLEWNAVTQAEAHTWRGAMEASALREFLTDTNWGELDLLLLDLPPGTDRLVTLAAGRAPGRDHRRHDSVGRLASRREESHHGGESGQGAGSWPRREHGRAVSRPGRRRARPRRGHPPPRARALRPGARRRGGSRRALRRGRARERRRPRAPGGRRRPSAAPPQRQLTPDAGWSLASWKVLRKSSSHARSGIRPSGVSPSYPNTAARAASAV